MLELKTRGHSHQCK